MSLSIPAISIPSSKKDLWLNINSDKSIISWYNSIYDRRKSKSKKTSSNSKKKNTSQSIDNKGWRQTFFDFCEENYISDDEEDKSKYNVFGFSIKNFQSNFQSK